MKPDSFLKRIWGAMPQKLIAFLSLLIAIAAFYWSLMSTATSYVVPEVRKVIEAEARAARFRDANASVSLFVESPLTAVHDAILHANWIGCDHIHDRYSKLPDFESLVHIDVQIEPIQFISGIVHATSITIGKTSSGITLYSRERWEFEKVNQSPFMPWTGEWKIKSFTVNIPIN